MQQSLYKMNGAALKRAAYLGIARSTVAGLLATAVCAQVPERVNYQGRLMDEHGLVNTNQQVVLRLYDHPDTGGELYAETQTVFFADGLYTFALGRSNATPGGLSAALMTDGVWLEVEVNGVPLEPREQVKAVGYALKAAAVTNGAISGMMISSGAVDEARLADSAVTSIKIADDEVGTDDLSSGSVTSAKIADGAITAEDVASNTFWGLTGNTGTTPGTHFLGTTDNQALELHVNGQRALRLEPTAGAPNLVGGAPINRTDGPVKGAVVGGGEENVAAADYATVGGGWTNQARAIYSTVAGGERNRATAPSAVVVGGRFSSAEGQAAIAGGEECHAIGDLSIALGLDNTTYSYASAIVGGDDNIITNTEYAFIGGGQLNRVGDITEYSAIIGGFGNTVGPTALYAIVAGGESNVTAGSHSFTAGRKARALHHGTFVWADATGEEFASTASNQFLIRANGNVGIDTNRPSEKLTVNGSVLTAGDYKYTPPRVSQLNLPAYGFIPATGAPYVFTNGYLRAASGSASNLALARDVPVPQGATVQHVTAYLFDNSAANAAAVTVDIKRRALLSTNLETVVQVSTNTLAPTQDPAVRASVGTNVAFATVDHAAYQYFAEVRFTDQGATPDPDIRFYGLQLGYSTDRLAP
jgi:hypothetical protein